MTCVILNESGKHLELSEAYDEQIKQYRALVVYGIKPQFKVKQAFIIVKFTELNLHY